MVTTPANYFLRLFRKIWFVSKKLLNDKYWDLNLEFQMLVARRVKQRQSDQGVSYYNFYMGLN